MSLFIPRSNGMFRQTIDMRKCREHVTGQHDIYGRQCERKAIVKRDGVGYCRQHDPEAKKAARAKGATMARLRDAVYEARSDVRVSEDALVEEAISGAASGMWNMDIIRDKARKAYEARKALDAAQAKYSNHTTGGDT